MIVFFDVEASSLGMAGYPIEVGWVIVDGLSIEAVESHLIKPTSMWRKRWDWDEASAQIHGITLDELERDGETIDQVCRRLVDQLAGVNIYSDAPEFDGRWLGVLFGVWSGHGLIVPIDQLPMRLQHALILLGPPAVSVEAGLYSEEQMADVPVTHRAGDDARRLALQYVAAESFDMERRSSSPRPSSLL